MAKEKIKGIDWEETSKYLMRKMSKKQMAYELIGYRLAINTIVATTPFMKLSEGLSKLHKSKK